jgi:hypothetical protein
VSDHDNCDHDPIECTYDALVGEYQEAVAERDRLRAVVHEQDYALALAAHRDAERDRLRAVVDAVRELASKHGPWPISVSGAEEYNRLMAALTQLDYHDAEATDG